MKDTTVEDSIDDHVSFYSTDFNEPLCATISATVLFLVGLQTLIIELKIKMLLII